MALPLLLGLGAGILGGGRYLLKQADERRSESLLGDLNNMVYNSSLSGTPEGNSILATAQSLMDNDSIWNRSMVSDQIGQMMGQIAQLDQARQFQQAQMTADAARARQNTTFGRQDKLLDEYQGALGTFATINQAYQQAQEALAPGRTTADKLAVLYNFFSVIDPGRAVQNAEQVMFNNIGGITQAGENWFRSVFGKGINETSAEEIGQALYRQYKPAYERAQRQKSYYDGVYQDLLDQQYNVYNPQGSLGIDWTMPEPPKRTEQPGPVTAPPPAIPKQQADYMNLKPYPPGQGPS